MTKRVILKDGQTLEILHPRTQVASVEGLNDALAAKADKATTYTKTEVDNLLSDFTLNGEYYAQ